MKEYEYSFKVTAIKPYVKFCEDNNYQKINETWQQRIVYENKYSKDIITGLITKTINGKSKTVFDCKNVGKRDNNLKASNESVLIKVTTKNKDSIMSVIDVLGFYETANNTRIRYEYVKDNVKFEIDNYISPKMKVVAIEGEEKEVEKVYSIICKSMKDTFEK